MVDCISVGLMVREAKVCGIVWGGVSMPVFRAVPGYSGM